MVRPLYDSFQHRQQMLLDSYEIFHYCDTSELQVALHFHDFYECYYLLSGDLSYQIGHETYALSAGDLLLISPGQLHRPMLCASDVPYERIVLWISLPFLKLLSSHDDLSCCFREEHKVFFLTKQPRKSIEKQLLLLIKATEEEGFGKITLCGALLSELLVEFNRSCNLSSVSARWYSARSNSLVQKILAYLDEHIDAPLDLEMLSSELFLSKYHLSRTFHRDTGITISQMLMQKRMILARNLLHRGLPITDVYVQCGFSDYSGFYKAFKREYLISPSEYIKVYL